MDACRSAPSPTPLTVGIPLLDEKAINGLEAMSAERRAAAGGAG